MLFGSIPTMRVTPRERSAEAVAPREHPTSRTAVDPGGILAARSSRAEASMAPYRWTKEPESIAVTRPSSTEKETMMTIKLVL